MFRPRSFYFYNVVVVTSDGVIGHSVRVVGGKIAGINQPQRPDDISLDGNGGTLLPGFINAHDHLELNNFPRLKYRDQYTHSLDWIETIEAKFDTDPQLTMPRQQDFADRLWQGGLKNLLSGVTTVCHHNPLSRPLRRPFPVRVVQKYGFCHSLFRGDDVRQSYAQTPVAQPWLIHLAEGTDGRANEEYASLQMMGAVGKNTILVHGVGLTDEQKTHLIQHGGGLVWCPSSNLFTLGQTAKVERLANAGILALGTDSRLTGVGDMLDELQVAWGTGQLSGEQLLAAVGKMPAFMLNLSNGAGDIRVGGVADLLLMPAFNDNYDELFSRKRTQVNMVMNGGKIMLADPAYTYAFGKWGWSGEPVWVDGTEKRVARWLVKRWRKSTVPERGFSMNPP